MKQLCHKHLSSSLESAFYVRKFIKASAEIDTTKMMLKKYRIPDAKSRGRESSSFCDFLDRIPEKKIIMWGIKSLPGFLFEKESNHFFKNYKLSYENWVYFALIQYLSVNSQQKSLTEAKRLEIVKLNVRLNRVSVNRSDIYKAQRVLSVVKFTPDDYHCDFYNHFSLTEQGRLKVLRFSPSELESLTKLLNTPLMKRIGVTKDTKAVIKFQTDYVKASLVWTKSLDIPPVIVEANLKMKDNTALVRKILNQISYRNTCIDKTLSTFSTPIPDIAAAIDTIKINQALLIQDVWREEVALKLEGDISGQYLAKLDLVIHGLEALFLTQADTIVTADDIQAVTLLLGIAANQYTKALKKLDALQKSHDLQPIITAFELEMERFLLKHQHYPFHNYTPLKGLNLSAKVILNLSLDRAVCKDLRRPFIEAVKTCEFKTGNWGLHHILYMKFPTDLLKRVLSFEIYRVGSFGFSNNLIELGIENIFHISPLQLMCSQIPCGGKRGDYLRTFIACLNTLELNSKIKNTIPQILHATLPAFIADRQYARFLNSLVSQNLPTELILKVFRTQSFGRHEKLSENEEKIQPSDLLGISFSLKLLNTPDYDRNILHIYLSTIDLHYIQAKDKEGHSIEWHLLKKFAKDSTNEAFELFETTIKILGARLILSDQSLEVINERNEFTGQALTYTKAYDQDHSFEDGSTTLLCAVQDKESFAAWRLNRSFNQHYATRNHAAEYIYQNPIGMYMTTSGSNALHLYFSKQAFMDINFGDISFLMATCKTSHISKDINDHYPLECLFNRMLNEEGAVPKAHFQLILKLLMHRFSNQKFITAQYKKTNHDKLNTLLDFDITLISEN